MSFFALSISATLLSCCSENSRVCKNISFVFDLRNYLSKPDKNLVLLIPQYLWCGTSLASLASLEEVAVLGIIVHHVEDGVDKLRVLGIVSFGSVVVRDGLAMCSIAEMPSKKKSSSEATTAQK